jgi:ATP-dependent helicase/nuclease subunit B
MNYRALEKSRLQKLLGQWLEEEKQRAPFEVVNLESKSSLRFGDLEISLRLDRVDRIGSKLLIIDYKSGLVKPSSWAGERPADPQLPMYLLASNPAANGCAFAQIRGGAIKFVGNSDSQLIPNEKLIENWSLQVDKWQAALGGLAHEFTSGKAGMQIFNAAAFAFQSHLLPLNRWSEEAELKAKADGWTAP